MSIEAELTVNYLEKEKLYGVSLYSKEPYGKHFSKHIYVTAIFHKKEKKAIEIAKAQFAKDKEYRDREDRRIDGITKTTVMV